MKKPWFLLLASLLYTNLVSAMAPNSDVANSINQFAFDLYPALSAGGENVTFSPASLSLVFGMLYAGAKNATAISLKEKFYFGDNTFSFHKNLGAFINNLNQDRTASKTIVAIANDLWLQDGFTVLMSFADYLTNGYGTKALLRDFKNDASAATASINETIKQKTHGEIEKLFKTDLDKDTRIVLTNAIYFNAKWRMPFDSYRTFNGDFTKLDGSTMSVQYMGSSSHFLYGEDQIAKYLELPYEDKDFYALIVLPKDGQEDLNHAMNAQYFRDILSKLAPTKVNLRMPKFSQSMSPNMKEIFQSMGLNIIFDKNRADFSGINGADSEERLVVDAVMHEAVVKMNETGTTAAAASGISLGPTNGMIPVFEMSVPFFATKPFVFFIVHRPSQAVLFMGRVTEPMSE